MARVDINQKKKDIKDVSDFTINLPEQYQQIVFAKLIELVVRCDTNAPQQTETRDSPTDDLNDFNTPIKKYLINQKLEAKDLNQVIMADDDEFVLLANTIMEGYLDTQVNSALLLSLLNAANNGTFKVSRGELKSHLVEHQMLKSKNFSSYLKNKKFSDNFKESSPSIYLLTQKGKDKLGILIRELNNAQ